MPAKRSFSGSSRNVTSSAPPTNLFDLNNDEAAKFWISENAVQLAEYAIEQKISSMSGSHDIVPVILKSMKSYTIKLYSSAIKSGPVSTSTIFIDFLTMLETYDTTVNDDDHSIQQYLVCCITLRNSLPTSFRSSLVRTLAARSLIPTVTSLNSKGGSTFVVDWLKKLNDLSKVTSKILIGTYTYPQDSGTLIFEGCA